MVNKYTFLNLRNKAIHGRKQKVIYVLEKNILKETKKFLLDNSWDKLIVIDKRREKGITFQITKWSKGKNKNFQNLDVKIKRNFIKEL